MYVKNAPGLSVRDPDRGDRLPADRYRPVPDSDYWHRRVRAGDVVAHDSPPLSEMEGYDPAATVPPTIVPPAIVPPAPSFGERSES